MAVLQSVLPHARPRIHFVVCDDGSWLRFISERPKNWYLFNFNDTQESIKAQLLFSFGLNNAMSNSVTAFLDSEYGTSCAFANLFIKVSKKIHETSKNFGPPDYMYVVKIPPTAVLGLPPCIATLWPESKTALSICDSVEALVRNTRALEASALPYLSTLFPDC